MSNLLWLVAATLLLGLLFILWRRRRAPLKEDSSFGRWQKDQAVTWQGRPVTVVFDYSAYLQEPERRKVNVHTVQLSAMGERSIVAFCHDAEEDRTFKLSGVCSDVLVERSKEELAVEVWLERLTANDMFTTDASDTNET
jgi:hypothetical protein